jgi:hypothetical protein
MVLPSSFVRSLTPPAWVYQVRKHLDQISLVMVFIASVHLNPWPDFVHNTGAPLLVSISINSSCCIVDGSSIFTCRN